MLFNAVQIVALFSTAHAAYGAMTSSHQNVDAVKRHWFKGSGGGGPCNFPTRYGGCQGVQNYYYDDGYVNDQGFYQGGHEAGQGSAGYAPSDTGVTQGGSGYAQGFAQGGAGLGVSGGLNAMVQGWGRLTPAFTQLQSTFSSGVSVDVAIKAATSFGVQLQSVSSQFASCQCSSSRQAADAFQEMAVKFFSSFQLILQTAQVHYRSQWQSRFRPIFERCSSAFISIQGIAASLNVDLRVILQRAQINLQLFAGAGLNLSDLLRVNLSIGGFVSF